MLLDPVTRSGKMAFRRDGILTWWVQRDRKACGGSRDASERPGGLLNVPERICWGWEKWGRTWKLRRILGKIWDCWGLDGNR